VRHAQNLERNDAMNRNRQGQQYATPTNLVEPDEVGDVSRGERVHELTLSSAALRWR
jgi:hypothetical protein